MLRVAEVFEILLSTAKLGVSSDKFSTKIRSKSCNDSTYSAFKPRYSKKKEKSNVRSDNFTMFTTTYLTRPRKHRSSLMVVTHPPYSLVLVHLSVEEEEEEEEKSILEGKRESEGGARDPILANARETLCISPAHIDTLIPRETEV